VLIVHCKHYMSCTGESGPSCKFFNTLNTINICTRPQDIKLSVDVPVCVRHAHVRTKVLIAFEARNHLPQAKLVQI